MSSLNSTDHMDILVSGYIRKVFRSHIPFDVKMMIMYFHAMILLNLKIVVEEDFVYYEKWCMYYETIIFGKTKWPCRYSNCQLIEFNTKNISWVNELIHGDYIDVRDVRDVQKYRTDDWLFCRIKETKLNQKEESRVLVKVQHTYRSKKTKTQHDYSVHQWIYTVPEAICDCIGTCNNYSHQIAFPGSQSGETKVTLRKLFANCRLIQSKFDDGSDGNNNNVIIFDDSNIKTELRALSVQNNDL